MNRRFNSLALFCLSLFVFFFSKLKFFCLFETIVYFSQLVQIVDRCSTQFIYIFSVFKTKYAIQRIFFVYKILYFKAHVFKFSEQRIRRGRTLALSVLAGLNSLRDGSAGFLTDPAAVFLSALQSEAL
jgi:hypothetical protein